LGLNLKRLMKPALLLSLLGLAMTLGAVVRLRPYVHGRYTDPRAWNEQPVACTECFVGLLCVGVGVWLFLGDDSDEGDGEKDEPK
jgi:hypothetical protein